jgi:hypothetical protein
MMNDEESTTRNCTGTDTNVNRGAATDAADDSRDDGMRLTGRLREFMGSIPFCKTDRLTWKTLLDYLVFVGDAEPCKLMEVPVRELNSNLTRVAIPVGSSVGELKNAIYELTGTRREKQQLFNTDATDAVDNKTVLHAPDELLLVVGGTQYDWTSRSTAVTLERFRVNDAHTVVAMAHVSRLTGEIYRPQTVSASPSMCGDADNTVFTASFRATMPHTAANCMANCMVKFGVAAMTDGDYADHSDPDLRYIYNEPVERWYVDPTEAIPFGTVVRLTLNFEEGTLTFSVNGVPRDGGRIDIPTGVGMKWFVEAALPETVIEIGTDMMSN